MFDINTVDFNQLANKYSHYQMQKLYDHTPKNKACPICKVRFDAQTYVLRPTAIYPTIRNTCSENCKRIFGGKKNKKVFRDYNCKQCLHIFVPHKNKPHQMFCSKACYSLFQKKPRPIVNRWVHKLQPPRNSVSNREKEWLKQFQLTHTQYSIEIDNKTYRVDGFNIHTSTIYEYLGSFWHGNPKKYNPEDVHPLCKKPYGDLYRKTQARLRALRRAGYKVVTKWG